MTYRIPLAVLDKIPHGQYCYFTNEYGGKVLCPYWSRHEEKPEQESGYCLFLNLADDDESSGVTHLWDQVKECAVNGKEKKRKHTCEACLGTGFSLLNKCQVCQGSGKV